MPSMSLDRGGFAMLKVMIVDDEMLVRVGIKSTIQWEAHGFSVIAEASNGAEALQKIRELHPDILLTDIRMPKMDGIELLRRIDAEQLPVESVIMSCYNEFELVRSAMKYGASDYLLKLSFTEEELLHVLERLKTKILARNGRTSASMQTESAVQKEQLIQLIMHAGAPERIDQLARSSQLCVDLHHAAVLFIAADPAFSAETMDYEAIDAQTDQLMLNLVHDQLATHLYGEAFALKAPANHILVFLNPGLDPRQMADSLAGRLREYLNRTFSIGIADNALYQNGGIRQIPQLLSVFSDMRYLLGAGQRFLLAPGLPSSASRRIQKNSGRSFSEICGPADLKKLPELVAAISAQMSAQQLRRSACEQIFTELFYHTMSLFQPYGGSINGLDEMCGFQLAGRLQALQFLSNAAAWFAGFAELAEQYWRECCGQWKRSDIFSAICYTQNNFHRQISSNTVAKEVGISPAYFSTLFKQETGQSFMEYLTELRMKKAMQLLEDKRIYIYEIGNLVGYPDPNYFCKVFKRYTGLSPEAYRKSRNMR